MNRLLVELVTKKDYIPVRDENGNPPVLPNVGMLWKDYWGSLIFLEVIDGDEFSVQAIKDRMSNKDRALQDIKGNYSNIFVQVFMFRGGIPQEKLEIIKSMQVKKTWEKKYLVCYTVQADSGIVGRHFKMPVNIDGLDGFLKNVAAMPREETGEVDIYQLYDMKSKTGRAAEEIPILPDIKPVFTYAFLALNIIIWILNELSGQAVNNLGVKFNPFIMDGQYWRLVTPMFLHANIGHLLINSYSLYAVGPTVEKFFGSRKFLFIYLISGIAGNVASFIFSINPSLGASGAIFGLLGALLFLVQTKGKTFKSSFGVSIIATIAINIFYGLTNSGIDNFGHIGGLVGGYLSAMFTGLGIQGKKNNQNLRWLAFILILALIFGGVYAGFNKQSNIDFKNKYEQQS